MAYTGRDPELWEQGCRDDPVRNQVVLPDLLGRLARLRPASIIDVGCGTGYLARLAAQHHAQPARWYLLEKDPRMLRFASASCVSRTGLELIEYDFLNASTPWHEPADLAFSCFSSLDFGMDAGVASKLTNLVRAGGSLVVYVPDFLEEVSQMCTRAENLAALNSYRRGATQVSKPDHFTGRIEPFFAHRVEHCIRDLLGAGSHLRDLQFLPRGADRHVVVMEFLHIA